MNLKSHGLTHSQKIKKMKKRKLKKMGKKRPLEKRAVAYKKIVEYLGKGMSLSRAMRESGYSDAYSKNPQQFKKTKKWKQLMEEYLPGEKLAEVHADLLNAHRLDHAVFSPTMEDEEIIFLLAIVGCVVKKIQEGDTIKHVYFIAPDNLSRKYALEMAYKLQGKFAPEQIKILRPFEHMNDEELAQYIRDAKKLLLKK